MSEEESDLIEGQMDVPIRTAFKFAAGGHEVEVEFMRFNAPTAKDAREAAALRQGLMRGIHEQLEDENVATMVEEAREMLAEEAAKKGQSTQGEISMPDEDQDLEMGASFLGAVAMSKTVDYGDFLETFKKLLAGGRIGKLNGVTSPKATTIDKISFWDLENLAGLYVRNFIQDSE